jgi:glycine cleavage system transcriptional repressor
MILQLDLSHIASIKDVRDDLAEYAEKTGLRVVLQHNDIFRVTNEIAMI